LPENVDFSVIDLFEKVTDKDAAVFTRTLLRLKGFLLETRVEQLLKDCYSLKVTLKKTDVVVVLLHDSGSRYIGKIYNDEWMKEKGFIL